MQKRLRAQELLVQSVVHLCSVPGGLCCAAPIHAVSTPPSALLLLGAPAGGVHVPLAGAAFLEDACPSATVTVTVTVTVTAGPMVAVLHLDSAHSPLPLCSWVRVQVASMYHWLAQHPRRTPSPTATLPRRWRQALRSSWHASLLKPVGHGAPGEGLGLSTPQPCSGCPRAQAEVAGVVWGGKMARTQGRGSAGAVLSSPWHSTGPGSGQAPQACRHPIPMPTLLQLPPATTPWPCCAPRRLLSSPFGRWLRQV